MGAFAPEQENHYVAPAFRQADEVDDPFIPYRDISETRLPAGCSHDRMATDEHRWAENQIRHARAVIGELRLLCEGDRGSLPMERRHRTSAIHARRPRREQFFSKLKHSAHSSPLRKARCKLPRTREARRGYNLDAVYESVT
jgi:hypothetical protein